MTRPSSAHSLSALPTQYPHCPPTFFADAIGITALRLTSSSVRDLVLLDVVDQGVRDVRAVVGHIRRGVGRVAETTTVEQTGARGRP